MKTFSYFSVILFFSLYLSCAQDNPPFIESSSEVNYSYETIVDGINIPWGMAFISESDFLVTEILGTLYRVVNGKKTKIEGLPEMYVRGQGGLLDVALHPDYINNNIIYITVSANTEGDSEGGNTALYAAILLSLIHI